MELDISGFKEFVEWLVQFDHDQREWYHSVFAQNLSIGDTKQTTWLGCAASASERKILMSSSTLHNGTSKHIKMLPVIIATITEPNCFKDVMNCNWNDSPH